MWFPNMIGLNIVYNNETTDVFLNILFVCVVVTNCQTPFKSHIEELLAVLVKTVDIDNCRTRDKKLTRKP